MSTDICARVINSNTAVVYTSADQLITTIGDLQVINAYGIVIKYQSGDFDTTGTQESRQPSTNETSSAGPTSTLPSSGNKNSSGLSSGAKIGIGVGVSLGVLLIGLGILLLFLHRREQRSTQDGVPATTQPDTTAKEPMYTQVPHDPRYELPSHTPHTATSELDATPQYSYQHGHPPAGSG